MTFCCCVTHLGDYIMSYIEIYRGQTVRCSPALTLAANSLYIKIHSPQTLRDFCALSILESGFLSNRLERKSAQLAVTLLMSRVPSIGQ